MPLVTKRKNVPRPAPVTASTLAEPTTRPLPLQKPSQTTNSPVSITEARHPAHPPQEAPYPVLLGRFHGGPERCRGRGGRPLCRLDDVPNASDRLVDAVLSALGRVDLEIGTLPLLSHGPPLLPHRPQLCLGVLVERCRREVALLNVCRERFIKSAVAPKRG